MSNNIFERSEPAPESKDNIAKVFDFDRRAFVLRVMLCAGLAACSIIIAILSWDVILAVLLLSIVLPLAIVMAWFAALRLRMAGPIVVLDRNGLWDQRLGLEAVPWSAVRAILLDRNNDVVLEIGHAADIAKSAQREEVLGFLPLGSYRQAGRVHVKLDDLNASVPEFLAAMDAMLPHHMQAPVCPAVLRRRPRQLVRPVLSGVVTGMIVASLVAVAGGVRDSETIYRGLGYASDLGVLPGDSGGYGFGRLMPRSSIAVQDQRVRLGYMYHEGRGVPRDDTKAVEQFRLAAAVGVAEAQSVLGFFRENGIGVPQDFVKALVWYRRAEARGDSWARTRLALMYRDGRGVPRDLERAFQLFRTSADQGDRTAQYYLGQALENGWGAAENIAAAIEWYAAAANQGHAGAEYKLGLLYRDGRYLSRDLGRSLEWLQRSGREGYPPAQFALGLAYELGLSVKSDPIQADFWYYLAEWHGHPGARARREQTRSLLGQKERLAARVYRQRWLREHLLAGEAKDAFADYRMATGPKAFAVSMTGVFAAVDKAANEDDAARRAIFRCQEYARTCLLYARGERLVAGMEEPPIKAQVVRRGQPPIGLQLSLRPEK